MSKSDKLYKIFMTSMIVIIAGLLLATGIIAIQKQIKLKTSFDYIPGVDVEVFVKNDDNPTEKLIFSNYANGTKGIYVDTAYCSLSATTLTFNKDFVTAYGNNFTLVVYNYSNFKIATEITSTTTAKVGENTVDAVEPEITPTTAQIATGESGEFEISCEPIIPQETTLSIKFEELILYGVKATINGTEQQIGEYSPKSSSQEVDITYTDFYGLGGLLEEVSCVTALTSSKITIAANTTGPITIVPKGYTIGTYVDTNSTIFTPNTGGENTIEYEAFKDYKYLQFNHTSANTYSKRWIIIGGGKSETTTYGAGAIVNADSLRSNQLLLLSEIIIENQYYDNNVYTSFTNYNVNTRGLYYQSDVRYLCRTYTKDEGANTNLDMSAYVEYMKDSSTKEAKTIQTSWSSTKINCNETYNNNSNVDTQDYMFLLAYDVNSSSYARYSLQEYIVTNYLGAEGNPRIIGYNNSGVSSYWWLRSGSLYSTGSAYLVCDAVIDYGGVNGNNRGVRPAFVLNLA